MLLTSHASALGVPEHFCFCRPLNSPDGPWEGGLGDFLAHFTDVCTETCLYQQREDQL